MEYTVAYSIFPVVNGEESRGNGWASLLVKTHVIVVAAEGRASVVYESSMTNTTPNTVGQTIDAAPLDGSVRYLGIWLDRKLSFKKLVETMAAKARRVASGTQYKHWAT
ncbi:hypothetical protein ACJ73_05337 [Blastomyces percursus]|uniref:Uncharacterized protein n=1 Tax=Blastomyces percursus TaxID=1658174 RepID=A0A1J9Q435_9EURO|nr:hypothetical protein ACJ73_05337 [Blastomyces percursus]